MCQKAFGNYFAPLVSVPAGGFTWTRGMPRRFQSSNHVARGFCADCGTPLTYEAPNDDVAIAIGAFDHPEEIAPVIQFGTEGRMPYFQALAALPERRTEEDVASAEFLLSIRSYQHPDHDTPAWPAKDSAK
ncbi:GFA family protein [Stappia sp. F7233]|uniref:GFA family protein n=2 Tax=Stappia albiluteola TaxID=2758565 RepID=A0A839ALS1_9HYPH|nr:GFA family protein [Stappia albiluteola]